MQPGSQASWILLWPAACLKLLNPPGPQFPHLQKRDGSRRSGNPKHFSLRRKQTHAVYSMALWCFWEGSLLFLEGSLHFLEGPLLFLEGSLLLAILNKCFLLVGSQRAFSFQEIIPRCWADGQYLRERL